MTPRQPPSTLSRALAFPWATAILVAQKLLAVALAAAAWPLLRATPLRRALERWPRAAAPAAALVAIGLASPAAQAASDASTVGWLARAWLCLAAIGACAHAATAAAAASYSGPATLADLEAHVRGAWPERWFAARLRNPLDAYLVRLLVDATALALPCFVAIVVPALCNGFTIALYFVVLSVSGWSASTLIHIDMHNRPFAPAPGQSRWTRTVLAATRVHVGVVLELLLNAAPRWVRVQHLWNHHVEENGADDTLGTARYDRRSYLDFGVFVARVSWSLATGADVAAYLRRKGRRGPLRELALGLAAYHAANVALLFVSPAAALFRWLCHLAAGLEVAINAYAEHGLVDPSRPAGARGTTSDSRTPNDHANLGDGAHLQHHEQPGRHWSLLAAAQRADALAADGEPVVTWPHDDYRARLAAFFSGNVEPVVGLTLGGRTLDRRELGDLLAERTAPLSRARRGALQQRLDAWSGRMAAALLG